MKRANTLRKGQTSIEFLVLLGFMLIVFIGFFTFSENYLSSVHQKNVDAGIIDISQNTYQELSLANAVTTGYSRIITLPETIDEELFSVRILDDVELVVNTSSFEYILFLPFDVVVDNPGAGSGTNPEHMLWSTNRLFTNESGVFIEQNN